MKYVVFFLALLLLVGCTIDNAVRVANSAADFGDSVEKTLADTYKSEQVLAVDNSTDKAGAEAAVSVVRKKYAPYWMAYSKFRAAWLALSAVIQVAKANGDTTQLQSAIDTLLAAEMELAK